jgi:hypothetical protein
MYRKVGQLSADLAGDARVSRAQCVGWAETT